MTESSDERGWVAETRFSGVIAELRVPRATVRRLLPPELQLAPHAERGRTYPLLLMFGDQTGSAVHLGAMQVRTGVRFREVLFGVQCMIAASQAPALFVPLMYCDEPVSTWSGTALYGFNKRAATMEWLGESFVVAGGDAEGVVFHATTEVDGPWGSDPPRIAAIARLPVLGRRRDGGYVTSRFEWDWSTARCRPVRLIAAFDEPLVPGLGQAHVSAPAVVGVRGLRWRISWPEARHVEDQEGHTRSRRVTAPRSSLYNPG